jgi:hypothetical protein
MRLATLARHQSTGTDYERMLAAGMFEKIELLIIGRRVRHRSLEPCPSHQVIHANVETIH